MADYAIQEIREKMMPTVSMNVNGQSISRDVEERTLLVQFLREHLKLTGTHVGCDTSQCGACVIHVDGVSVKSCTMLAIQAEGCEVKTIDKSWNPMDCKRLSDKSLTKLFNHATAVTELLFCPVFLFSKRRIG